MSEPIKGQWRLNLFHSGDVESNLFQLIEKADEHYWLVQPLISNPAVMASYRIVNDRFTAVLTEEQVACVKERCG